MILEDEKLIALDTQNKLRKKGLDPHIAMNHNEAIALNKTIDFDVMLVDISLADSKDGIETVIELKKEKETAVVYATAYDNEKIIQRLEQTRPSGYILKPYDEAELLVAVNIAIERKEKEDALKEKTKWITSILNTISDIIIVTDLDGNVSFANLIARDVCNQPLEEGFPVTEVVRFFDDEGREFDIKETILKRIVRTRMPIMFNNIHVKLSNSKKEFNAHCRMAPLIGDFVNKGIVIGIKKLAKHEQEALKQQASFHHHT